MTRTSAYTKKSLERLYKEKPWVRYLYSIITRCCNKNSYCSKQGIKQLLTRKSIEYIWFRDKAYLLKRPSIHRLDHKRHYTIDNCVFIEWARHLNVRPIKQLDLQGKFIRSWNSIREAARTLKIDPTAIYNCINKPRKDGNKRMYYNFHWEYL